MFPARQAKPPHPTPPNPSPQAFHSHHTLYYVSSTSSRLQQSRLGCGLRAWKLHLCETIPQFFPFTLGIRVRTSDDIVVRKADSKGN
ncbi:hypothetical protein E2C01_094966 [Portunus trituberculatus]|uniref:Uncharacterized protein n=1 Tax=Portunus trituberculatus TaxID=210409 RepID=A0A5B7JYA8_PORTR|nr:hypothetical protein [Portunus trituberculatus]